MPETIFDLGKKVKAKFPGQYDDLADDEVGRRVKAKFPGAYDDFGDTPGESRKTGFWGRVGENLNPMPLVHAAMHPIDTAKHLLVPDDEIAKEAADAFKRGDYGRYALSQVEDVPIVGPLVRQAEQDIKNKDWGALAGTAATAMLPKALGKIKGRIPIASNLNAVEKSAVAAGERAGVPVDLGTATGNKFVRTAQETVEHQPFTASKVAAKRQAQDVALGDWGRDLAGKSSPGGPVSRVEAGEQVIGDTTKRIQRLDDIADKAYSEFRDISKQPQNTKQIQVGTQRSAVLGPDGNPITLPDIRDVQMPVDYTAIKGQVQQRIAELEKTIPEAQRQASPGLAVLKQIAGRPDAVDANTAIKDLSSIQNIARGRDELPEVRGVSKGLAASAVPQMRRAIDDAAAAAGPRASQVLERGRAATRSKYATNDVLRSMPDEPARVFDRLTSAGDRSVDLLRSVQKSTPKALPSVARSYVEGMVDDMTYQGDVRRAQSAVRAWHSMGDETKAILFPNADLRQGITDFVNLAEMMTRRVNTSRSGVTWATIAGALNPKVLAGQLIAGRPAVEALFGGGGASLARSGIPFNMGAAGAATGAVVGANLENLPHYAKGGIAGKHGPELALVGEEGPEAVIPLTAGRETVPEKPATLKAQLAQLADGLRAVVMFPRGTPLLKRPKSTKAYADEHGNTYIFDPEKTSQQEIDAAIQSNTLPELLGATDGGMGAPDKSKLPADAVAVVGRNKSGTTVQATATDGPHIKGTMRQTKKVTPKGGKVSVEPAENEIERRQRQWFHRDKPQWFHKRP